MKRLSSLGWKNGWTRLLWVIGLDHHVINDPSRVRRKSRHKEGKYPVHPGGVKLNLVGSVVFFMFKNHQTGRIETQNAGRMFDTPAVYKHWIQKYTKYNKIIANFMLNQTADQKLGKSYLFICRKEKIILDFLTFFIITNYKQPNLIWTNVLVGY